MSAEISTQAWIFKLTNALVDAMAGVQENFRLQGWPMQAPYFFVDEDTIDYRPSQEWWVVEAQVQIFGPASESPPYAREHWRTVKESVALFDLDELPSRQGPYVEALAAVLANSVTEVIREWAQPNNGASKE